MLGLFFPVAVHAVLAAVVVVPVVRMWRRHRVWPVVFRRDANPFQRLMGALMAGFLAATAAWSVLVAFVEPEALGIWSAPPLLAMVGWTVVLLGVIIVLVAQAQMGASWRIGIDDRTTELVTGGLFALARNPIFSGLLLSLGGFVAITPSPWTVMGLLMVAALIGMQVRLEEQHLLDSHGPSYAAYAARVGRFVPLVGRLP
jgi:protein-S-isoprenylcysteine O-methyltransferase Ste14